MHPIFRLVLSCGLVAIPPSVVYGQQASTLGEAITGGSPILSLRARYETVDQTGKDRGEAITLRTLIGWRTQPLKSTSVTSEAINVARPASDYNDTLNGKTHLPVNATLPASLSSVELPRATYWTALRTPRPRRTSSLFLRRFQSSPLPNPVIPFSSIYISQHH